VTAGCLHTDGIDLALWDDLDAMEDDFEQSQHDAFWVGTTLTFTSGLTVGYVLWTIRGGLLLSSLLAQMPAWRFVDPLVVLDEQGEPDDPHWDRPDQPGEEESLASIVEAA
jgi:hypothetical protein